MALPGKGARIILKGHNIEYEPMISVSQGATNPALLAAIVASPDDDLPRLVYADWLEEDGQLERAQFIRTAVEYDRIGRADPKKEPVYIEHWDRRHALGYQLKLMKAAFTAHDWFPCTKMIPKPPRQITKVKKRDYSSSCPDFGWDRGFIVRVTCRLQGWLWWGKTLMERHPTVRAVRVTNRIPLVIRVPSGARYMWILEGRAGHGDDPLIRLPKAVYDRLVPEPGDAKNDTSQCYNSSENANKALSDAVLSIARE